MGAKALEALRVPSGYSEIVYATTTLGVAGTIALRSAKTREIITTTVTAEGKVLRQAGDSAYIDVSVGNRLDG